MDLDMRYSGIDQELIAWPTALCRLGTTKSCSQKNGIDVRVSNLLDTFQCHCKPGYYGTYADSSDGNTLLRCNFCPKYGTSVRGTGDMRGCYCRAGTYEVQQSSALGGIGKPSLVCKSCPSLAHFCPGGPGGRPIFDFVFDTVASQEAQKVMLLETGAPLACPTNTSTRHRFASSVASCIANPNMRYDVALGYWVFCDDSVYDSENITEWLEPTSQSCNRICTAPSSVLEPGTGNCRCDVSKGYGLKIYDKGVGVACVCQPGWYQIDGNGECVPCPRNSYCDGTVRRLCAVQFSAPMNTAKETDCVCLPGFYFLSSTSSCKFCQIGNKCPGGRGENTIVLCSPEELCRTTGMYIPLTCPRGTTKSNLLEDSYDGNSPCSSNGIVKEIRADSLYSNVVQKNGVLYGVDNVKLSDACVDSTFQRNLAKVLRQDWPMPVVGFFGAFQWLCGAGRVLVPDTSVRMEVVQTSLSNTNVLHAAFTCTVPEFAAGQHNFFLVNGGLAVMAWTKMGVDGFISSSYHDTRVSLLHADDHLVWNVFLSCNFPRDYSGRPGVSEIDTCLLCDVQSGSGFLVLGGHIACTRISPLHTLCVSRIYVILPL